MRGEGTRRQGAEGLVKETNEEGASARTRRLSCQLDYLLASIAFGTLHTIV